MSKKNNLFLWLFCLTVSIKIIRQDRMILIKYIVLVGAYVFISDMAIQYIGTLNFSLHHGKFWYMQSMHILTYINVSF